MALLPFFNKYPYTNFEQLNLDWMMEKIGSFDGRITKNSEDIADLNIRLDGETAARTAADNELNAAITTETAARTAADNALSGDITNETTARANADSALSDRITAEVAARIAADNTLQGNINSEATARANADSALTNLINGKFTVVNMGLDQGNWVITSDNQADLFDLTKNVMLYQVPSGLYFQRSVVEKHGNNVTARFVSLTTGEQTVQTTVEGRTFTFSDLPYISADAVTIVTQDNGETIYSIIFDNEFVNDTLDLICEDRIEIDSLKPVIIEITAGDNNCDENTVFTTNFDFDDLDKLSSDNVIAVITTPNNNEYRLNKINYSHWDESIQFIFDISDANSRILNFVANELFGAFEISIIEQTFMMMNNILLEYNSNTSSYDVIEGDLSLLSASNVNNIILDRTNIHDIREYRLTGVYQNAGGTGPLLIFSNSKCEIDSVTNLPKQTIDQFTFTWNSGTSTYDIEFNTYVINSAS